MQLSYSWSFSPGTKIISSRFNDNFASVATVVNGNLNSDNFDTITGAVEWSISTNVKALSIATSSTDSAFDLTATGVWAAGKAGIQIASAAAQTTGDAAIHANLSSTSTTIPTAKFENSGTGAPLELVSTKRGFLPPRMTTTQRDAISAPVEGEVIFNTTTNVLNAYDGSTWSAASGGGGRTKTASASTGGATSTTSTSYVDITNAVLNDVVVLDGQLVTLTFEPDGNNGTIEWTAGVTAPTIAFLRDGVAIAEFNVYNGARSTPVSSFCFHDSPGAGTFDYKAQYKIATGSGTFYAYNVKLVAVVG